MDQDTSSPPVAVSRRPLVLAGVAGFAVGSVVLGLLWALSDVEGAATADARAACAALERVGELPRPEPGGPPIGRNALGPGGLSRLAAAKELAEAAAELDSAHEELAEAVDGVSRMVMSLNYGDASGHRHYANALSICGRT
ncbi:hypothetical protein EWH70_21115 [Amycolatopsis suaedae]|uniref:Uncharacterized protein n=1 Tax=Amycolatopsis suaedae TaxID=2510978 RepID=A0A4Q7J3V0_9PSEU|nr:hypothetical protein EWH70_21115 [Amycolatopsis suaedae]